MEMDSIKKYQLILTTLFAIACIVYLVVIYAFDVATEIMKYRFVDADALFNGIPMDTECPPFAIFFIAIPRIFSADPFGYNVGYIVLVFVFFIIGLHFVNLLTKFYQKDQKKMMLIYTVLMLILFEFVVDRYDVFAIVLTLIAVYFFVTKKYVWAFVILSLGMMTKLYPAILFPIFLTPLIINKDWKNALTGIVAFVVVALAVVGVVLLIDSGTISYFISYHSDRPLQIESVAASFIYPFKMLGLTDAWIDNGFGSDNLSGPLPDAVASVLTPLMLILILFTYPIFIFLYKKVKGAGTRNVFFGAAIVFIILLFIIVGKVFSAQYLLWIIAPMIFIFLTDIDTKTKHNLFWLTVIIFIMTQINFAYSIGYLGGGSNIDDFGMMIVLARNILTIILLYFIGRVVYDRYKTSPETASDKMRAQD